MAKDKSTFLAGKLLLAMPGLGDPRFQRAVIFICAHDENGAMGLVVNNTLPGLNFTDIIEKIKIPGETRNVLEELEIPVYGGGPVEPARGFLLHSSDFRQADTIQINDEFSVTGTVDALKAIASGNGPQKMLFILGYAGWSAGQLDGELQQNAWLTVEADQEIVFETANQAKWESSLKKIGVHPSMLSSFSGRA